MIYTHALSVLLNLARLTWIRVFPCFAWCRTSVPICSPSLSQSVQMNRALQSLAWSRMFLAIANLSCITVSYGNSMIGRDAYRVHRLMHRGFKQIPRWTGGPAVHLPLEVEVGQMANHTGHGDRAGTPRATKIEVEEVILDILVSTDGYLPSLAYSCLPFSITQTYGLHRPSGQMLGHGLCDGRFLSHTKNFGHGENINPYTSPFACCPLAAVMVSLNFGGRYRRFSGSTRARLMPRICRTAWFFRCEIFPDTASARRQFSQVTKHSMNMTVSVSYKQTKSSTKTIRQCRCPFPLSIRQWTVLPLIKQFSPFSHN